MNKKRITLMGAVFFIFTSTGVFAGDTVAPSPNGISFPTDYKDWRLISSSHRTDNNTLRVIVGNDVAVEAARNGKTKPWPKGSVLGKLIWKDSVDPDWESATVPGEFVHAEFMIKDTVKYKSTGGWGYARWKGMDQKPYGMDASSGQVCYECHMAVEDNDYVFSHPAKLP